MFLPKWPFETSPSYPPSSPRPPSPPPSAVAQTPAPFATPPVLPGTPDVATLVARVKPAVVNITTIHEVKVGHSGMQFPGFGDLFRMMPHGQNGPSPFEQGPDDQGSGGGDEVMKQQALGSGFLVDAQGHVVTNAHVIDGADMVKVKLADDREFRAKVVGKDTRLDVAVLQLLESLLLQRVAPRVIARLPLIELALAPEPADIGT